MNTGRPPPPDRPLFELFANVVAPFIILTALSSPERLGPAWAMLLAISLPAAYGFHYFVVTGGRNMMSLMGTLGILFTGGVGLLHLDRIWVAVNEAAMPGIFGLALLITSRRRTSLVQAVLLNKSIRQFRHVSEEMEQNGQTTEFSDLLRRASYLFALAFFVAAVVNSTVALYVVTSPGGTTAFNHEVARMGVFGVLGVLVPVAICGAVTVRYVNRRVERLRQARSAQATEFAPH